MLIRVEEHLLKRREDLEDAGLSAFEADVKLRTPHNQHIPRIVPQPPILVERLRCLHKWLASVPPATTSRGEEIPLYKEEQMANAQGRANEFAKRKILSDPLGILMYFMGWDGKNRCKRGSNKLEALHRLLRDAAGDFGTSPEMAQAKLEAFCNANNLHRGTECAGYEIYPHTALWLLRLMNIETGQYKDVRRLIEHPDTKERFFTVPARARALLATVPVATKDASKTACHLDGAHLLLDLDNALRAPTPEVLVDDGSGNALPDHEPLSDQEEEEDEGQTKNESRVQCEDEAIGEVQLDLWSSGAIARLEKQLGTSCLPHGVLSLEEFSLAAVLKPRHTRPSGATDYHSMADEWNSTFAKYFLQPASRLTPKLAGHLKKHFKEVARLESYADALREFQGIVGAEDAMKAGARLRRKLQQPVVGRMEIAVHTPAEPTFKLGIHASIDSISTSSPTPSSAVTYNVPLPLCGRCGGKGDREVTEQQVRSDLLAAAAAAGRINGRLTISELSLVARCSQAGQLLVPHGSRAHRADFMTMFCPWEDNILSCPRRIAPLILAKHLDTCRRANSRSTAGGATSHQFGAPAILLPTLVATPPELPARAHVVHVVEQAIAIAPLVGRPCDTFCQAAAATTAGSTISALWVQLAHTQLGSQMDLQLSHTCGRIYVQIPERQHVDELFQSLCNSVDLQETFGSNCAELQVALHCLGSIFVDDDHGRPLRLLCDISRRGSAHLHNPRRTGLFDLTIISGHPPCLFPLVLRDQLQEGAKKVAPWLLGGDYQYDKDDDPIVLGSDDESGAKSPWMWTASTWAGPPAQMCVDELPSLVAPTPCLHMHELPNECQPRCADDIRRHIRSLASTSWSPLWCGGLFAKDLECLLQPDAFTSSNVLNAMFSLLNADAGSLKSPTTHIFSTFTAEYALCGTASNRFLKNVVNRYA